MKFLTQFIKNIVNRNTFAIATIFIVIVSAFAAVPAIYGIFFLKKKNIVQNQNDIDDIKIIDSNENNKIEDDERIIINNLKKNSNLTDFNIDKINLKKTDLTKNTKIIKNNTGIIPIKKIYIDDINNDNVDKKADTKKIKTKQEKLIDKYIKKIKSKNEIIIKNIDNNNANIYDAATKKKIYSGGFAKNLPNGYGSIFNTNNENILFKGYFSNGNLNGRGTIYDDNGIATYKGCFSQNKKNGEGAEYYDNGKKKFVGTFIKGQKKGSGEEFYQSGRTKTSAIWKDDRIDYNSKITEYYDNESNGIKFEGFKHFYTKNNNEEKNCKIFNEEGNIIYEGTMNEGIKWNGTIYDNNGNTEKIVKNGEIMNVDNTLQHEI